MVRLHTSIDMMHRSVEAPVSPQRIISLVPSLTELLYDLGLDNEVVGLTKFCIKPNEWFQTKTRVGGTKTVDFEKIKALKPDLIIANKEENTKEDIDELLQHYPVWISDINTYNEALIAIQQLGQLCGKEKEAQQLVATIENKKKAYKTEVSKENTVVYLIWKDPFMAVGKLTYIDNILLLLGYENIFKEERYKEITLAQLKELNPAYLFLSSEPYPFSEKHLKEMTEALPNTNCKLVDGEIFSWYGSRLLYLFDDNWFL